MRPPIAGDFEYIDPGPGRVRHLKDLLQVLKKAAAKSWGTFMHDGFNIDLLLSTQWAGCKTIA
jgi:hypothetical protein